MKSSDIGFRGIRECIAMKSSCIGFTDLTESMTMQSSGIGYTGIVVCIVMKSSGIGFTDITQSITMKSTGIGFTDIQRVTLQFLPAAGTVTNAVPSTEEKPILTHPTKSTQKRWNIKLLELRWHHITFFTQGPKGVFKVCNTLCF